ncbi:DUF3889 domain-containing protein [Neobacillus sp. PS3-34]|uniref:DUF3889 domain-containing protein n=1 Tax=Neobacillus sp. PS3-34 TaxID=3070678 RepID=UPI0027E077B2|nr:DUF3889 domain-containing protein [Neobacillus sp. PS3-34]WML49724.1 DUF3889 domain-containing protein [Neobacillus sp. PS3-34]
MKKHLGLLIAAAILLMSIGTQSAMAQKTDYEKYGRIAISVVKADYPEAEVREYEYLGREKVSDTDVVDSFRFQIKEKGKMSYVTIKIKHNLTNNKLLNLTVETPQQ